MTYLAAALAFVAVLAWDFGRRWLSGESDEVRAGNVQQHLAHRTMARALETRLDEVRRDLSSDVDALRREVRATDEALVRLEHRTQAGPVDVSEFRAELDKHAAALRNVIAEARDTFATKAELKTAEQSLRSGQGAIASSGAVGNGRMRMPLR